MKGIAFDLETLPDIENIPPFDPADIKLGNVKDQVKIDAKIEEARIKYKEGLGKFALDPQFNLICCFGWCDGDNVGSILLDEKVGEQNLLVQIWDFLSQYDFFITFNGIEFDVPTLMLHSLFKKVRPAVQISTKKYTIGNHLDIRAVLTRWEKMAKGNMNFFLKRCLGRQKPEDIDGSMVQHYWEVGMRDEVAKYCEGDARDTWALYEHVREYYL